MGCETVQTWLFRADTMHPEGWPTELADHVQDCSACSQLARELRRLEYDWRHLPLPPEADDAKASFLRQLPALRASLKPNSSGRFGRTARWAAAAVILLSVSPFMWLMLKPGGATASSDIVGKLIDFNLELADADPNERRRLLAEREAGLRDGLQNAKLAKGDRAIAEKLLETAGWIAVNNDPVQEAERLSDIADKIVGRLDFASKHGNVRETKRCFQWYEKVWDQGVGTSIVRADKKGWEPEKKKGFQQQMERHEHWQREQFQRMSQHAAPVFKNLFESMNNKGRPGHGAPFHGFKK